MAPEILGTYSSSSKEKIGTGTTAKQIVSKVYWLVLQIDVDFYRLHVLNDEHLPSKVKLDVVGKDIINAYSPEPSYFLETFIPAVRELLDSENEAKMRFVLDVLDLEPEAGQTPRDCLEKNFAPLFANKETLIREQRAHLNAFGIQSRKTNLLNEALDYYHKSLQLSPDNENLLFNVARVYFDLNDINNSIECLNKALAINPDFPQAKKFLAFLKKFPNSE